MGTTVAEAVDPALLREPAEKKLFDAVNQAEKNVGEAIQKQDFSAAMLALSVLREPVDSFFEAVLVNDEDEAVRANRLALLARIRVATGQVADFSKIAGFINTHTPSAIAISVSTGVVMPSFGSQAGGGVPVFAARALTRLIARITPSSTSAVNSFNEYAAPRSTKS